ncbi:putative transcription factor interactor and regulator CCHC(Zn) family [Helianthus anomalus]
MEITWRLDLEGLISTKLGFDKSNFTCFLCKQKGHFKRECVNREVAEHGNPFHDDYYKKAIYHKNSEHSSRLNLKQIAEGSSKEKHKLYWFKDERALIAEVKLKTKEEILQEKTYRERRFADYRIEEMQKEYEEARSHGRWDKKRECYINSKGDAVVHSREVVYNDVLAFIPLSSEYYSKKEKYKDYLKKIDKIIRDVMTASFRHRDEERRRNG